MQATEKNPGVLVSDAESPAADGKGMKFDQMKEHLRMTELNRAQANLKAMKVFRVQNEKMYAEKELQELRRKEIHEPLDEALTTIEILQGKLQRRENMINKLRHYISVDLLKVSQNSAEENRAKVVELNQVEEHNQILLMDTISELQRTMENQQGRIGKSKIIIFNQQGRIKELINELQVQEFNHKEQIRHIESDKEIYLGMVESREHKIEVLMEEKEEMEEQVEELETSLKSIKAKLKDAEGQVKHLTEALKVSQHEHEELQAKYSTTEFNYLECKEALVESQERSSNLRERYDKLVAELDEMVEAGCIIPTAEELQAAKVRGKMKKHSSSNASAKHKGGTSSSTSANQKTKMRYRSFTSGGSLTGGGSDSLDGGDGSSIELHDGSIEEAGVNTRNTGEQSGKDYRNPEGVKFQTRAQREDSDIEMQILENRAMRQGNVLSGEITHLRTVMDKMRADHEQALLRAEQSSKAAESGHNKLSAEVARLTAKKKELSAQNAHLKDELEARTHRVEELEAQSTALLEQVEELQKRPEIVTIEVPFVNPEEMVFDDESTRILPDCDGAGGDDAADGGQAAGVDSDGVGDCGDTPWGSYKANSNDYDASFDPNAYISDPPVDVATQAGAGASEFRDLGTQFPYQFDPDWHQNHVHSQTNVNDFMYPTEIYLETIFRDFITESQNFIPAQHLSILQLSRFHETDKEKASRLGMREEERPPLLEEEAQFRVKRAMSYLSALNDLRNRHIKYINKMGSWNSANTRMVIRCIDLVLQTTHNVLCPIVMMEESDYSELRRATDPGELAYYSDDGEDSQVFGEIKEITERWRRSTKAVIKRHSTFKLTESELVSDHNYGAPKGILNTEEGQVLSKAVVKYMNRAVRPRKTVGNADHLLELAEGRGAPPPLEKSLSHRHSSPPSRMGSAVDSSSRGSSASPPRSAQSRSNSMAASPSISAFAAKVLAVAAFAYHSGSDSSPEVSPSMARFRKKMSTTLPLPEEPESADHVVVMSGTSPAAAAAATTSIMTTVSTSAAATATADQQRKTSRVIDGYYNFGNEVRDQNAKTASQLEKQKVAATVELPPEVVGLDDVTNVKVRIKREKSVGISFQIKEGGSDDDESTNLQDVPRGRKPSRSPNKKGSVGYIAAGALASGDFVDYTRIPFDARSMENTYTGKKMSVSGSSTTTHRKASTKGRSHFKSHSSGGYSSGEDDRVRAIVATDVTASAPVTEPAVVATQISETASKVAAVMGVGIEMSDDIASRAQTAEIPTAYEETGDGDDAYGGDIDGGSHETSRLHEGLDLQMYLNQMDGTSETALSLPTSMPTLFDPAAVPNSSSDKEKASPAQNAITLEGSRPASSQAGAKADNSRVGTASEKDKRADVRTPTLSERADRLQLSTPLPPLQPDVFAALTAVEGIDSHHTTGSGSAGGAGGLRAMLKRNIEASAMAVYHLQDQQQRRDQLGSSPSIDSAAGVVVGKVGLYKRNANGDIAAISQHGSGNVHPPSRLKPSSHAKNIRNARHKAPKEIDWSNAPIPVVGPRGIPAAAGGAAGTAAVSPLSATGSNSLAQGSNTAVGMHTYGGANAAAAAAAFPRGDSYQLPLDGSFDLQKVFFSGSHRQAAHGSADGQDEVVVRNPSPVLSSPSGVPPHQQSDFVVAGQKRANLLKKEKVTNTVLFM